MNLRVHVVVPIGPRLFPSAQFVAKVLLWLVLELVKA